MVDFYLNCLRVVTVVVCSNKCAFCEIKNIAIVRVVIVVIFSVKSCVQFVLEPYFSFLSVSTSVSAKHCRTASTAKHASLRNVEVHF